MLSRRGRWRGAHEKLHMVAVVWPLVGRIPQSVPKRIGEIIDARA
jgi:hypothetical protein